MKSAPALCISLLAVFVSLTLRGAEPLRLNCPEYAPYTLSEGGVAKGIGVEIMNKLLKDAGVKFTISPVPNYGRAMKNLNEKQSDGFFLASRSSERDDVAIFIQPILVSHWTWFLRADSKLDPKNPEFKKKAIVSSVLNSNQHNWLTLKQYQLGLVPQSSETLVKLLLEKQKVDAVMTADLVFYQALDKAGIARDKVKTSVQEDRPLGIYISKAYAAKNPEVIAKITAAVAAFKPAQ